MYPWQSGSNGREETQTLHLNPHSGRWIPDHTHRQRHINVAIAYNIWQYYQITDDHEFLYFYGAEMLLEIARFWASIATYNSSLDRYEITGVMGPTSITPPIPGPTPRPPAASTTMPTPTSWSPGSWSAPGTCSRCCPGRIAASSVSAWA